MQVKKIPVLLLVAALVVPFSALEAASKQTYKTYTNAHYGYRFEYSVTLKPEEFDDGASVVIMYNPEEQAIPKMKSIQVYVESNVSHWTFEQLVQSQLTSPKVGALGEYKPKIKAKTIKVDKIKAKQMKYKNDLGSETIDVVFLKDNLVWHIAGNIAAQDFQRLIKSFKFIVRKK